MLFFHVVMDLPLVIHMLTSGPTLHRVYSLGYEICYLVISSE
jgi:hypothetical protein